MARGPTLLVNIGFDPAHIVGAQTAPNLATTGVMALVDTGATESCIDSGLAMQLQLPIVNRQRVAGAHGAHEVNIHLAQIHIPAFPFTLYGAFAAVDLIAGGQPFHALIGRTFLQHFKMTYDGKTGDVIISD
jgi:predicted aspartyl protease